MRRVLCVWLPSWPTLRLRRRRGELVPLLPAAGAPPAEPGEAAEPDAWTAAALQLRPLATTETLHGARLLAAVCPAATAAGLRVGMPLPHARAICPALEVVDADPADDRAALAALAAWCEHYTPLAAADPPEGLVLDIAGCTHLFDRDPARGEAALAAHLHARLADVGYPARVVVAGTLGAAWALTRLMLRPGVRVLPPGQERAALARVPVALLRLDARDVAGLVRLGVRRVEELGRLPRADLSARFTGSVLHRLDQALGRADEPVAWPHPPPPWSEHVGFPEPIGTPEDLARTLAHLAGALCARLEAGRLGGQRFVASFHRVDGARPHIAAATALPVRDPLYVAKLLAAKLETLDPGFGIEAASLAATVTAPLGAAQSRLADLASPPPPALAATLDTLASRLGEGRVWRPVPLGSHVPERSQGGTAPLDPPVAWTHRRIRPIRLLRRPEPIEAVAPVPDDPPVLFRWRGALHRVRAATGPERIAAEWWRRTTPQDRDLADLVRDYYRVEDTEGARFWLFRTGRHAGRPGAHWFLHGLFG